MAPPGSLNETARGVRDGDVVAVYGITRREAERMLESARDYRARLNEQIAWCYTVPLLGWFGRRADLERRHASVNFSIRELLRQIREAA